MVAVDRRTLLQCVVLSMLLHVWIIVLFGTTTYGGSRRDRDFGNALDVTLRALTGELGPGFRFAPGVDTGSPGTALLPRAGGAAPAPRGRDLARPRDKPAPHEAPPPAPAPATAPPAAEPLPRLNLDAPEVVDKPYVPAPPPSIEREVAAPVPATPRETVPPAPVERTVSPPLEGNSAPAALPEPTPAPRIEIETEPAPPIAAPEPVARPEPVTPRAPRELAPPAPAPAPRSVPSESAPRPSERIAPERAPEVRPLPRTDALPTESTPRLRFGAPEPDEDMFKPRGDVVTPSTEPGTAPRLDLDEAKKRAARAVVREGSGSRGLLPIVPPPPERESKEARALEKAAKPDCRNAYANMGLLAAVPLVASAIGDGGCRW